MRAGGRADEVEGVVDVGRPSRAAPRSSRPSACREPDVTGHDLGAQQLHAEDVGLLPLDVGRAHVDDAGQAEARADRRGGDAVLAGAGLGDDARLAHAPGQQDLAEHIVDLVRAGVIQLVALEVDLRAAEMLGQALGEIERRRPADIMLRRKLSSLGVEGRVGLGLAIGLLQLEDRAASAFRRHSGRHRCRNGPLRRVRSGRNWVSVPGS